MFTETMLVLVKIKFAIDFNWIVSIQYLQIETSLVTPAFQLYWLDELSYYQKNKNSQFLAVSYYWTQYGKIVCFGTRASQSLDLNV